MPHLIRWVHLIHYHQLVQEFLLGCIYLPLIQQLYTFDVERETIRVETWADNKDQRKGIKCFTRWGEVFVETLLTEVIVLFENK